MFKFLTVSALASTGFSFSSSITSNSTLSDRHSSGRIDTVDELLVDSYLGLWYTMYTNKLTDQITFKGGQCATAYYTLLDDGKIGVRNYETIGSKYDGSTGTDVITGYAYVPNSAEPGQLKVALEGVPGEAPYWVAALGPMNSAKLYDYSLVSDNTGSFLFVLARDVNEFNSKYDAELKGLMKDLGFTGTFTSPVPLHQGTDCLYESN